MRVKKKGRSRISIRFVFVPAAASVAPLALTGTLLPAGCNRAHGMRLVRGPERSWARRFQSAAGTCLFACT